MSVFFIDSGLNYTGVPITVVSGLNHLESETVYGLADGTPVGPFIVSGGEITLSTAASNITIGLKYKTRIKTLEPDVGALNGTSYGQPKEVHNITASFVASGKGVKIGLDIDNLQDIPELDMVGLATLEADISVSDGYTTAQVIIEQEQALPMFLSAINYDVAPGDT